MDDDRFSYRAVTSLERDGAQNEGANQGPKGPGNTLKWVSPLARVVGESPSLGKRRNHRPTHLLRPPCDIVGSER